MVTVMSWTCKLNLQLLPMNGRRLATLGDARALILALRVPRQANSQSRHLDDGRSLTRSSKIASKLAFGELSREYESFPRDWNIG